MYYMPSLDEQEDLVLLQAKEALTDRDKDKSFDILFNYYQDEQWTNHKLSLLKPKRLLIEASLALSKLV